MLDYVPVIEIREKYGSMEGVKTLTESRSHNSLNARVSTNHKFMNENDLISRELSYDYMADNSSSNANVKGEESFENETNKSVYRNFQAAPIQKLRPPSVSSEKNIKPEQVQEIKKSKTPNELVSSPKYTSE